jgi:4-hydroxyphenylpyruvate dioxygenase
MQRLRDQSVLYDRSEEGEFFHVYTQTFEDRFFFEIVQRTGGDPLFGAANAPARMAAQAQASLFSVPIKVGL